MPLGVDLIRFEKNLLQMGFFGAHDTRHSKQTTRRIEQIVNRDGQKIKVAAEFRASQEYGLPSTSDRDKYIAFMRIAMNQRMKSGGCLQNPVRFSGYQLLKELGLSFSGENYEDINRWGQRMVDTSITSEQVIYLAARRKYANKTVHVFRSFTRAGQSSDTGANRTEAFEVVLEDWLLDNLNQSYVVPEDFNAYRQLTKPTAKGIFGYLHLWFHASQGRDVEKAYSELCILLNVPAYRHVSKIKETMGRSLDELASIGYLTSWDVKPMATRAGYKLILAAGQELRRVLAVTQRKQLDKSRNLELTLSDVGEEQMTQCLIQKGVTATKARELVRSYEPEAVADAIAYLEAQVGGRSRSRIDNPAGFLVYILENKIVTDSLARGARESAPDEKSSALQDNYQEFVQLEIDRVVETRYPGKTLTKRLKQLVNERCQVDELFSRLPPDTQEVLADKILRDEVAKELPLPDFYQWTAEQRQSILSNE